MSFPSRAEAAIAAALVLALAGCHKPHPKPGNAPALMTQAGLADVPASGLVPGSGTPPDQPDPRAAAYYDNQQAVNEGMQLYKHYNCAGCHFDGGGGIGPPLMDDTWIYGGRMDQIYNSIFQGRPNGMPSWAGKIPPDQMWKIAAYVRSMSLPATLAADPPGATPSQHPAPVPRAADIHAGWQLPQGEVGPGAPTAKSGS